MLFSSRALLALFCALAFQYLIVNATDGDKALDKLHKPKYGGEMAQKPNEEFITSELGHMIAQIGKLQSFLYSRQWELFQEARSAYQKRHNTKEQLKAAIEKNVASLNVQRDLLHKSIAKIVKKAEPYAKSRLDLAEIDPSGDANQAVRAITAEWERLIAMKDTLLKLQKEFISVMNVETGLEISQKDLNEVSSDKEVEGHKRDEQTMEAKLKLVVRQRLLLRETKALVDRLGDDALQVDRFDANDFADAERAYSRVVGLLMERDDDAGRVAQLFGFDFPQVNDEKQAVAQQGPGAYSSNPLLELFGINKISERNVSNKVAHAVAQVFNLYDRKQKHVAGSLEKTQQRQNDEWLKGDLVRELFKMLKETTKAKNSVVPAPENDTQNVDEQLVSKIDELVAAQE